MTRLSRSFVTSEVATQDRSKSRNQHEKLRKEEGGEGKGKSGGKEQKIVFVWRNKTYIRHKSDRGKLSTQKKSYSKCQAVQYEYHMGWLVIELRPLR